MKIKRSQIQDVIKATFPDYTGRKCFLIFTERLTFTNTNWDGGTRNKYAGVNENMETRLFNAPAPWCNPVEGKTVQMPTNGIIVKHSFFCGRDLGITIYAHPSNAPKWLGT